MPFESPFNALRNQNRKSRVHIVDAVSRDGASGTLATSAFQFNTTEYPAGTRFQFQTTLHVSSGTLTGTVTLYNLTDGEVVTGTNISTSSTSPQTTVSAIIPVGSAAGNLKDTDKTYEIRLSVSGGTDPTDIVYLGSAALIVL